MSGDPNVRSVAFRKLARLSQSKKEQLIPPLIQNFKNQEDDRIVQRAMEALSVIGRPAVPMLIATLNDSDLFVRLSSIATIRLIGKSAEEAVPPLINALSDQHPLVREEAIVSLGEIGPLALEAVPALKEALKDPHKEVRLSAAQALEKIGG